MQSRTLAEKINRAETPICSLRRLVHDGNHNAFTDLIRWRDELYLTYRRSSGHAQCNGDIVLMRSDDGEDWESQDTALQSSHSFYEGHMAPLGDRLCMFSGGFQRGGTLDKMTMKEYVSFSDDGREWSEPRVIYKPLWRFWRPINHDGALYAAAYIWDRTMRHPLGRIPREAWRVMLLRSEDGLDWQDVGLISENEGGGECALHIDEDGSMKAYIRCGDQPHHLIIKSSEPPFTHWGEAITMGQIVQGQNIKKVDGRLFMAGRFKAGNDRLSTVFEPREAIRTKVWVHEEGHWVDYVTMPSGGDTSYPGIVPIGDNRMLMSYYSQHEYLNKDGFKDSESASDIFLAVLRTDLPPHWGGLHPVGVEELTKRESM